MGFYLRRTRLTAEGFINLATHKDRQGFYVLPSFTPRERPDGGPERIRTAYLNAASVAFSQVNYKPMVDQTRIELVASTLPESRPNLRTTSPRIFVPLSGIT